MLPSIFHIQILVGVVPLQLLINQDIEECKQRLLYNGNLVVANASSQKQRIVEFAQDFIRDDGSILIHSYSRVVMMLLLAAAKQNKRFKVGILIHLFILFCI
jgi:translation initiation factor 2B subunit (eIF-2B alpha/beta/delta family)